jgi:hypothetical protein
MKRAIGIVRVSEVAGREGDRFHTKEIQRERILRDCERWGMRPIVFYEELDVSGGWPIEKRQGLSFALGLVESGQAEAIVFAYRDRVDRSIEHGSELVRRMDKAGALLIADGKQITHSTHDGWRHATLESFLNEDQKRAVAAKMIGVHERVVAQGKPPFKRPPGYRKRDDGTTEFDPATSDLIHQAWLRRAAGQSCTEIHQWLGRMGVRLSLNTVTRMFRNRFYLGELHYRGHTNLTAHPALVSGPEWEAVQHRASASRGRYAKSDHLLARQGLLHCKACGSRMSVADRGKLRSGAYYRCTNPDCRARAAIDSVLIEGLVTDFAHALVKDLVGRASTRTAAVQAKADRDEAEAALSRLRRRLAAAGDEDEAEAVEMVREARERRDAAQRAYDAALSLGAVVKVDADYVFEHGTLQDCRDLILSVVDYVSVAKGTGTDRVTIEGKTL